jgi:hypothetical protein
VSEQEHTRIVRRGIAAIAIAVCGVLASACGSPSSGTVDGHLGTYGPIGSSTLIPLNGTVTAVSQDGISVSTSVGTDGSLTLHLAPGTYVIGGRSPKYNRNTGVCRTITPDVSVWPGGTESVVIQCLER